MPAANPDLNPEPAIKLTERLTEETLHGYAPIHGRSVNPGLTVALLGERIILVTAGPLVNPRKGEQKGECLKPQREEVTRRTGLVTPFSLSCRVPKYPAPTAKPSNKTLEEAKERNLIQ